MVIALIASVVTASQWTIGQLAVVWILTFVVRVGKFLTAWLRAVRSLSAIIAVGSLSIVVMFATEHNFISRGPARSSER